ncbi:hypothetical protein [Aeoliella sp.]|uniref:hypothetical protein n=1 Tax=Aeoliella sp. TaxID=2795800 RepID=UPI003CCC1199
MKTFQQVRDVLSHVSRIRSRLRELTEQCLEDTNDQLLATYLERAKAHDDFMQLCLADEVDKASPAALDTYIQFPDVQTLDDELDGMVEGDLDDARAMLDRLVAVDKRILALYDRVLEQSESRAVRDLIERLRLMEEQKARAKGWEQVELRDLKSY